MDRIRVERRPVRASITRICKEVQTELTSQVINNPALQGKLERLEALLEQINEIDERLITAMLDAEAPDNEVDEESAAADEYRERISVVRALINEQLRPACRPCSRPGSPAPSVSSYTTAETVGGTKKKSYKLPKIELKKFNGDLKEWIGFWAQFQKIHDDEDLHASDKFQYLVQAMVPGSRARVLVESYPQSENNYQKVIEALKTRFGDKTLLTELYVREMISLIMSNAAEKSKKSLALMYDELESNMRALETLGVTSEQTAMTIYPLVESSLPEELIKVWQRSSASGYSGDAAGTSVNDRLKELMKFLAAEVKGAERLAFVRCGFNDLSIKEKSSHQKLQSGFKKEKEKIPTTAGLHAGEQNKCLFCERNHESRDCIKAQKMTLVDKKECVKKNKCCFQCLRSGHQSKTCKVPVRCIVCKGKHLGIMCPDKAPHAEERSPPVAANPVQSSASNLACSSQVILKTLMVTVIGKNSSRRVRALIDDGSQRSYVSKNVAEELCLKVTGHQDIVHSLFGGVQTTSQQHVKYEVLISCERKQIFKFEALDQPQICGNIPRVSSGPWMRELKQKRIWLSDVGRGPTEIEVLIGADVIGSLMTGQILHLRNGLTAVETKLGWTIMGQEMLGGADSGGIAMMVTSLTISESSVEELWRLETIGIRDPAEHKTKQEKEIETQQHFLNTVSREEDGRYSVCLPWIDGVQQIPDNKVIAEKRLLSMTRKLVSNSNFGAYHNMFKDWLREGIIEDISEGIQDKFVACHYLPHRAVLKPESVTTPVRPVFDASCKTGRFPSLNDCLEKGPNLLELIPSILLRFREGRFGVVSDIRKAFLMVGVNERDRDFLRFLWWENSDLKKMKTFRHRRVVFGVNCSPFLLGAVIQFHLRHVREDQRPIAEKLLKSLYVDNCVTSVNTPEEYEDFKKVSTELMADAKMELRLWQSNAVEVSGVGQATRAGCGLESGSVNTVNDHSQNSTSVLGYKWNFVEDNLELDFHVYEELQKVTKRAILSCAQKIYDPIGFTCPVTLLPKLILQEAWALKTGWDEEVSEEMEKKFLNWYGEHGKLEELKISRNCTGYDSSRSNWQLHTFTDASQHAYAAAVFLRTGVEEINVQLVQAKSRVSPLKKVSIPRLELLGCTIGSRLADSVKKALEFEDVQSFYWSDSSTALAWINRNDEWGTFVGNRVAN